MKIYAAARRPLLVPALLLVLGAVLTSGSEETRIWPSTRVGDLDHHARTDTGSYPFRGFADEVLAELDLEPGDVVVDIGAGDGWWAARMAPAVGADGIVHASEIKQRLVDRMKRRHSEIPQLRPYLCPEDGTGLEENSVDLAFFAQVYHHLDADGQVDYLRHLKKVLKPTGRIAIIEKYRSIATRHKKHDTPLEELVREADEAGWVPVRYELLPRTYHYLVILVQRELFPAEPERL